MVVSWEAVENSFSVVGLTQRASIELSWAKIYKSQGKTFRILTSHFFNWEDLREPEVAFAQVE